MSEPDQAKIAVAPPESSADFDTLLSSLRAAGAHRFDPVRLHYIESLARRATAHNGSAKRVLDAKVAQALAAFKERFDQAQYQARKIVANSAHLSPNTAADMQQLHAAGERRTSLRELIRQLEQHAPEHASARPESTAGPRSELKTIRHFRNTWSKLSVDRQVAQALEQVPKNAGPINSHMLVLRSLVLMRDISPDYLNRFMSYADTLLCLDQGEQEKPEKPKDKPKRRPAAGAAKKQS